MVSDRLFTSEDLHSKFVYFFIYFLFIQLLLKMCFIAMFTCFDIDLDLQI